MDDLPPLPSIPPGRYRHYKGGLYDVLGVVRHSETLEPLVRYRPLRTTASGAGLGEWVRPFAMFGDVDRFEGRLQPRFTRIDGPPETGVRYTTDRLRVRSWRNDDLPALQAVYGDADAMRWVGEGRALTADECERWLVVTAENYRRRGYGMFTIEPVDSSPDGPGPVIGFIGLVHPAGQADAEVKYALARAHWGQGYATEAVRGLLDHAARDLGLTRVVATAAPPHLASHRVLVKAGLRPSELRRNDDGSLTQTFVWEAPGPVSAPPAAQEPEGAEALSVQDFLHHFEALALQEDFDLLRDMIDPQACFRFSDGDFRGHAQIQAAFEKTWRGDPSIRKASFHLSDIEVLSLDACSAAATYTWHWAGAQGEHCFTIRGRGTRVLRRDGPQWRIVHEHLSRFPAVLPPPPPADR